MAELLSKRRFRRLAAWLLLLSILGVAAAELAGRAIGLHRPVLYEKTSYGYRPQPNQDLRRLGNRIFYNEYGLRSDPIAPAPPDGAVRVLCLGDSITNGGTWLDQAETYPAILQRLLQKSARPTEVLNASAGGWALDNEAGWLAENGTFGAHILVLEVATHDLFQSLAGSDIVDTHPFFPSRPPASALVEVWSRHLLPRLGIEAQRQDPGVQLDMRSPKDIRRALENIDRIAAMARKQGARLFVVHIEHPTAFEPQDALTIEAKRLLREHSSKNGIELIESAARMRIAGDRALFRDSIHPNAAGNRVLAETVAEAVAPFIDAMY